MNADQISQALQEPARKNAKFEALTQEKQGRQRAGQKLRDSLAVANNTAITGTTGTNWIELARTRLIDTRALGHPKNTSDRMQIDVTGVVTKTCIIAAFNGGRELLEQAKTEPISPRFFSLVSFTKGRAFDKVQAAGDGEGLQAWRACL
eukprot:6490606-Amphidinium_carterae.1